MRKLLVIATVFLPACVQLRPVETGDARIANDEIVRQIKEGLTKEQVESLVGKPETVDFTDAGNEKWGYIYGRIESRGSIFLPQVKTDTHTLTIMFDEAGRVSTKSKERSYSIR